MFGKNKFDEDDIEDLPPPEDEEEDFNPEDDDPPPPPDEDEEPFESFDEENDIPVPDDSVNSKEFDDDNDEPPLGENFEEDEEEFEAEEDPEDEEEDGDPSDPEDSDSVSDINDENSPSVDGDGIESESNESNLESNILSTALSEASVQRSSPITAIDQNDSINSQLVTEPVEVIEPSAEKVPAKLYQLEEFLKVTGRFEGDPPETVYVRVISFEKKLQIISEFEDEMNFDLSRDAFVFEDTELQNTVILEYRKNVVILTFSSADELVSFMKNLPEEVFLVPSLTSEEEVLVEEKRIDVEKEKNAVKEKKKASSPVNSNYKFDRVKGTSVEDILESGDTTESKSKHDSLDKMFHQKNQLPLPPQRRLELIETYISKPKYSVRRISLLCQWINSLHVWPQNISILTLHKEICNGLLLARLVKKLNPTVQFVNLNEKALSKKPALENLEQALGHIWRAKSLNNTRIPTASDIYSGNTAKTAVLLNELYSVYVQRPLYKSALKLLKWYNAILKQYQRPLPNYVLDDGNLAGVWPHFQSGTALFCVLYHFYGSSSIGDESSSQRLDPLRIVGEPNSICDFRDNLSYIFCILEILGIDVIWTVEDWISNPDTELILLQLSLVYEQLRNRQCTLPPANGDKPGLTSGPNGEALVIGLVFSDALSNFKFVSKSRKAVRLGYNKDSMSLLPIEDNSSRSSRFSRNGYLPKGMVSSNAKVSQISLPFRELNNLARGDWNARTKLSTDKDKYEGLNLVMLLREHHNKNHEQGLGKTELDKSPSKNKEVLQLNPTDIVKDSEKMIEQLEKELADAQLQFVSYEEALADRYLQLESNAPMFSIEEYEAALLNLEKERTDLESEKIKLQEHFAHKLSLIKERKIEAHKKSYLSQKTAFMELTGINNSPSVNATDNYSTSKRKLATGKSKDTLVQAERGWIKLSAKMDTHNFHLKNKQAVSVAAFQTKITPKHLLVKTNINNPSSETENFYGNQNNLLATQHLSTEEMVSQSFKRFKYRLHSVGIRWLAAKQQDNGYGMVFTDVNNKTNSGISLPEKSFNNQGAMTDASAKFVQIWNNIRNSELELMYFEDERRRLVIAEKSLQNYSNFDIIS